MGRFCFAFTWAFLSLSIGSASAATVTFTGIPKFAISNQWVEDGIVGTTPGSAINGFGYNALPDSLHMDDSGAPYPPSVSFTMTGTQFDAVSVDVISAGNHLVLVNNDTNARTPTPFDNVRVQGFRGATLVADAAFYMGDQLFTYMFDASFSDLTKLVIYANFYTRPTAPPGFRFECDSPCAHFNIDNVTLTAAPVPVPIPPALPLLATVIAALGLGAWRRLPRSAPALFGTTGHHWQHVEIGESRR